MTNSTLLKVLFSGLLLSLAGLLAGCPDDDEPRNVPYLAGIMDQYHDEYDVYTDADAAGNHFVALGMMPATATLVTLPPMVHDWILDPHSGITCIRATLPAFTDNWGGWFFLNGLLTGSQAAPEADWGTCEGEGVNLEGASALSFYARGEAGGERVTFIFGGVNYPNPCGDSCGSKTIDVTLAQAWTRYSIDLSGRDLSSIRGGFGWSASTEQNGGHNLTFYLDDIKISLPRLNEPRLLVSYEAIAAGEPDRITMNAAFVYDNALAILYFLAVGDTGRACLIADALVYAIHHDRSYSDGRLRNAYQGGDLVLFPGWKPNGKEDTIRMPGRYDGSPASGQWYEDEFQVSTHTGNMAWAMLALISCYRYTSHTQYLDAATTLGEWVETNCRNDDAPAGYTGGYEGWEPNAEHPGQPVKLVYKATEHNLDLYAAFHRLYTITGEAQWEERALRAKSFVEAMWDDAGGKLWTGTKEAEGGAIVTNQDVVPVDIQAWAILAMPEDAATYRRALDYAEAHHKVGNGYDFDTDRDGVWFEGTAQMAAAYRAVNDAARSETILEFIESSRRNDGGVYAADRDGLTTGLQLPNLNLDPGSDHPWLYYRRVHVGATAWFELAARSVNPFWLGE